ncbi:uncharacterized protein LY89DRAFT_679436 [Mollisia scopiformis]|uniref:GPI anchored protein n=1 Tax=Mollisia scopiformis TaxID=149040 RepID=A0A194XVJ5_MOLSC|nr:uncharacterized protein LY89DRAFT_679436 [Mollisia scopiformis]KUJ24253.1 hypothetical protein LY89DRAFT_679436 [Mollisia scopiformis]
MHSTTISVLGLALATLSLAQSSTISLFIPGADSQSLVASIVGSDATATTYAFQCAPGTDADDCGFPEVVTLTEGPAIAAYTFAPEVDANGTTAFAGYVDCSLAASSAVCAISAGGTEANDPGLETSTLTGTDYSYMPVVITAGALASNTGSSVPASTTSAPSSSSTGETSGTKTSGSSTKTSGSQTSSGTAAQTSGSSSKTSTAGGSAITGGAAWMVGGAALALAAMV